MARIELEIDDTKGEIIGEIPPVLDALFKRTETTGYGTGLKKGREDGLTEAQAQAEAKVKAEREKWEKENPVQRVRELEEENLKFRESEATLMKRFNDNARQREEIHAKEIADKAEAVAKRDQRLNEQLLAIIRSEARAAGARDEALPFVVDAIVKRVGYDNDFQPYVKDESGQPHIKQGKPVPVPDFVKEFLSTNAIFRKPTGGTGGGARGGATYQGQGQPPTWTVAEERFNSGDRSPAAINELYEAMPKKKAS